MRARIRPLVASASSVAALLLLAGQPMPAGAIEPSGLSEQGVESIAANPL